MLESESIKITRNRNSNCTGIEIGIGIGIINVWNRNRNQVFLTDWNRNRSRNQRFYWNRNRDCPGIAHLWCFLLNHKTESQRNASSTHQIWLLTLCSILVVIPCWNLIFGTTLPLRVNFFVNTPHYFSNGIAPILSEMSIEERISLSF